MMKQDFLAIVSFACDVVVDMPLTLMDDNGKNNATYIIENLYTRGRTDLGLGLMEGLSVLNDKDNKQYRDMILIFTDGEVNEGERNASKLVEKYNEATKSLNRASCVPIAAFTIGQYVPDFLRELSSHLGSDAFYWLNEEEDFESDMLLPIFLRESTHVTDIAINMETLNGVTFNQRSLSRPHMKESSDTNLKYFIHGLPVAIKKHIPFSLMLPQDYIENLLGQKIVHIEVTYLDESMEFQQFNDYINLSNITLNECKMGPKDESDEPMNGISAYMVVQDTIYRVWEDSQSALIAVADEKYRRATLNGIDNAEIKLRNDDREGQKTVIFHATNEIVSIRKTYIVLVEIDSFYAKHLRDGAKHWIAKLNTVGTLESLGRIFALKSSIETEMPTSKGVFEDVENQLYLPEQIEEKLTEIESDVKEEKKKRQLKGKKYLHSEIFQLKPTIHRNDSLVSLLS
uniref:uncharacterized protein LOC120341230 n=1 Tax=Styela clava TaxID=7725 RepID=UPI00193A233F|nr:uncharacterized protein LOC120341230 [Styela clava]